MTQKDNLMKADCYTISNAFHATHERDGFNILEPTSLLHPSVPTSFIMSAGLIHVESNLNQIVKKSGKTFTFTQPCFRHFDAKKVGNDTTHLSLFHMAASFHVGATEREIMLPRLWKFLTEEIKLSPKRLWVTYLDDKMVGRDTKSYDCWSKIGVNESHLLGLDQNNNFWKQSQYGNIAGTKRKCGPHTEIFYEREDVNCGNCLQDPQINIGSCRCGRFVEISNTLFIEKNITNNGKIIAANAIFSECVIGIERLSMVLQGAESIYHTLRFKTWRNILLSLYPTRIKESQERSLNIILDHLSAFATLTQDGAPIPGRGGRKQVMRKLARRAITQSLLIGLPFDKVLAQFFEKEPLVQNRLEAEYRAFSQTIEKGKKKICLLLSNKNTSYLSNTQLSRLYSNEGIGNELAKKLCSDILAK